MKGKSRRNAGASIRARLLDLAHARQEDFQLVLNSYANERFLYRLGQSSFRDRYVLKGAVLFTIWTGHLHRATKDLDLLGHGSHVVADVEAAIKKICETAVDDGITFDASSFEAVRIKEDAEYEGVRVKFRAELAGARIPMQIDVGFGDTIGGEAALTEFPVLLPMQIPLIRVYPKEFVVAEKFHAMVVLDIGNSRMKDFYDVWSLCQEFPFAGPALSHAIQSTFKRRETELPAETPLAFSPAFYQDERKKKQWAAFADKFRSEVLLLPLESVCVHIRGFLMPVVEALNAKQQLNADWRPEGPWAQRSA